MCRNSGLHVVTHRSLCSGVNDGADLSRSSIKMKSFPSPSYLANSMVLIRLEESAVKALQKERSPQRSARRMVLFAVMMVLGCRFCGGEGQQGKERN